jgi:hypothetical protein
MIIRCLPYAVKKRTGQGDIFLDLGLLKIKWGGRDISFLAEVLFPLNTYKLSVAAQSPHNPKSHNRTTHKTRIIFYKTLKAYTLL